MYINPMNVIRLLLVTFQTLDLPESPINDNEVELKESIEKVLKDAMAEFNHLEIMEDTTLDFQEPFKDIVVEPVEDNSEWGPGVDRLDPMTCSDDEEDLSYEYKQRAVEFWRSAKTKKNLKIETVQNKFKKVKSVRQLRRWANQINRGGTYMEKLSRISEYTLHNLKNAIEAGLIVHDVDLRRWALRAQKLIGNEDIRFRASSTWIKKFKKVHRITSRKINKFVSRRTLESKDTLQNDADKFISEVQLKIKQYGLQNIYNSDQSGFQLEIHSGRTLAEEGTKQIECLVQSVSATTHSYTIQPTISGDGKLLSPLLIVLKESSGRLGPIVEKTIFRPPNVFISVSKSGKLTSEHFKVWLKEVFFPNVGKESVLLIDSWSGHCPEAVSQVTPRDKQVIAMIIPKGTTGKIQPLDVYGFRIWKNYVKHFSDSVMLMDYDIDLHLRNNIIKLQSLVHNQLSSPRYENLFRYAWFKSGYTEKRPDHFEKAVEFAFETSSQS